MLAAAVTAAVCSALGHGAQGEGRGHDNKAGDKAQKGKQAQGEGRFTSAGEAGFEPTLGVRIVDTGLIAFMWFTSGGGCEDTVNAPHPAAGPSATGAAKGNVRTRRTGADRRRRSPARRVIKLGN